MVRIQASCLFLLSVLAAPLAAQEPENSRTRITWPPQGTLTPFLLFEEPYLPIPAVANEYTAAVVPLLKEALESGNADLQRDAAVSIIQLHEGGFRDCSSLQDPLAAVLKVEGANRLLRKDVARALVAIDARESADALFKTIGRDADLVRIVEPALARWYHQPAQEVWRRRLENVDIEAAFLVRSAILGAGLSRDQRSMRLLQNLIVHSPQATYRLAAAKALGSISETGLEEFSGQLLEERSDVLSPASAAKTVLHRLMAVEVIRNHRSDSARKTLLELAADSEGAIASVAWESLLRSDPVALRSLTRQSITAQDARVRGFVVDVLLATPDSAAVEQLGLLLDDRHRDVRNAARGALLTISKMPELREDVIAAGVAGLHRDRWEGLEQSAVLLGILDHEPAADRCFELLTHPRTESAVAAAWALRKFMIPATLPRMFQFCEDFDETLVAGRRHADSAPIVAGHLFEAMGQMLYRPAEPLLRQYIAKKAPRLAVPLRQSAIAAIGWLNEDSGDEELSALFLQRWLDEGPLPIYERENVRIASILSIGRIKAPSFEAQVRSRYPGVSSDGRTYSMEWALTRFTGEPLKKASIGTRGFPLLPLKPIGLRLEDAGPQAESADEQ